MLMHMRSLLYIFAVVICWGGSFGAIAQSYPSQPIKLIVPFSAGGGTDATARIIANQLTISLGQTVIVENHPGAGGTLAEALVSKAPANGYTLLFDAASFGINPAIRTVPFDPRKDFIPIALVMTTPNILVVRSGSPFTSLKDFLAYAKANPGKLSYASPGAGTGQYLSGELFNIRTNAQLLHVPYKGGGPAIIDLIGGQVDCYFANGASATPFINDGKLIPLGVTSAKRSPFFPNIPTFMEQGIPEYDVKEWAGIFAPAGTSNLIVEKIANEVRKALKDPKVLISMQRIGVTPETNTPAEFAKFVDSELSRWSMLVTKYSIKTE